MLHLMSGPSLCFLELTPDKQCHVFLCNDLNTSNPRIFNKWQHEFESKDDFGRGNKNNNIILAKRQRRKAERKWRASKAHIDLLSYRTMRNRVTFLSNKARSDYYTNFIIENSADQRRLFRASKSLLNLSKGSCLPLSTNDYQMANDFGKFFAQKIADIRSAITNQICLPVTINATSSVTVSCFSEFDLLSESEVFDLITASSKKSCPLDPIPTKLLTEYVDVLLPPITKIINLSLDSGHFPRTWKYALVRPLLKKDGLPPVFKNFRPVSNLAFISKLVETVVAKQLRHYLNCNNLFPVFQSAYQQNHSTETALIKVMNDILLNMNNQRVTLLILLDLSAAFDTVDHDTMLRRLEYSFGIQGKALSWFASYLSGRTQRVMINESLSKPFKLECGVPQGSCLGPLLFTLYTSELFEIIKYHLPMIHCYADDSQVYISFSPNDRAEQLAVVLENVPYSSVLSKSHNMFLKVIYSRSHYPITSSTTFQLRNFIRLYSYISSSSGHTGNSDHCRLLSIGQLQYIYVKITTPYCHATW